MENNEIKHNFEVIERKALNILEEYNGANNFLINLKQKFLTNKNFVPTIRLRNIILRSNTKSG